MSDKQLTWEEEVQWLKSQSDCQDLVKACYYDDKELNLDIEIIQSFDESLPFTDNSFDIWH